MNTVDENRVAKKKQSGKIRKKGQIDWMITLLPLGLIAALSILFFLLPEQSNTVLAKVRFFLGDTFGVYYLAIGLGVFLLSFCLGIHDVYVRPCGRHSVLFFCRMGDVCC